MSEPKSPGSVQVIDRTFKILETIARNGNVSLKDIYTTLGLNKASTLRIVTALCSNGYVYRDSVGGNYSLTFKAFEVGVYAVRNVNYISFIKSFLEQMSSDLGVIAQFSVEDNNELLCLESYDPTGSSFSVYTRVGQRSPLYSTSAGKAILSTYSNDEIRAKWPAMNVRAFTRNTITSLDALLQDIGQIRQRNYAMDNEESEPGLFCIGTVLLNYNRRPIGAISLSTNRMTEEIQQNLSSALLDQSRQLSYMLGYSVR
nr:IclR family transcriptional regulator [uncultured Oscillibacter sp.]